MEMPLPPGGGAPMAGPPAAPAPMASSPLAAPPVGLQSPGGPPVSPLRQSLTPLPMTNDEVSDWQSRIEASKKRVTQREKEWDTLAAEYDPNVQDQAEAADLKSNTHFRNIHTKTGQLFVRSPNVILTPKGPALTEQVMPGPDGLPHTYSPKDAVMTRQAVLNYYMSSDEIDGLRLMDECLYDMQGYSGFACVLVGYRSTVRPVQRPRMQPDPNHIPNPMSVTPQPAPMVPVMDPLTGQPQMDTLQVPIHEEWYAEKFSSKKILFDELLRSPRHQKASRWIGRRMPINKRLAKKLYGLSDEEMSGQGAEIDDRIYEYAADKTGSNALKDILWYTEIFYKAIYFTDEDHPEKIHHLVFFDCVKDKPVVHRPSPDQTFDDRGQLTPDSLRGFPIKVGSLRDALDSPFPKADAAFTNAIVKQINTYMQQSVMLRDASIGKYFYDTEVIDTTDLDKMKNGEVGAYIGLKPGALFNGAEKIFYTTAQIHQNPDDWRALQMLKSYMDETLGISATQAGATTDTVRSATEINAVGASSAGRQEKEKSRAVQFYLEICRAVDGYVFRYATGDRWVQVVGPDGVQKLTKWNKTLGQGCYTYDIEPDSQLVPDAARDRQQKISAYNVLGPDPLFRRIVAIRDIARLCGWDPALATIDEATANAQQQLAAKGIQAGQPPHPNVGPTNKHQLERSGGTPNAPNQGHPGDNRVERNPPPPGQMGRPMP